MEQCFVYLHQVIFVKLNTLANLRKIHENSKVSNKQFQADAEEQKLNKVFRVTCFTNINLHKFFRN